MRTQQLNAEGLQRATPCACRGAHMRNGTRLGARCTRPSSPGPWRMHNARTRADKTLAPAARAAELARREAAAHRALSLQLAPDVRQPPRVRHRRRAGPGARVRQPLQPRLQQLRGRDRQDRRGARRRARQQRRRAIRACGHGRRSTAAASREHATRRPGQHSVRANSAEAAEHAWVCGGGPRTCVQ